MGSIFGSTPSVQAAPVNPADDAAAVAKRERAAEEERRRRLSGGRASNILTGPLGSPGAAPTASAQLLGGTV